MRYKNDGIKFKVEYRSVSNFGGVILIEWETEKEVISCHLERMTKSAKRMSIARTPKIGRKEDVDKAQVRMEVKRMEKIAIIENQKNNKFKCQNYINYLRWLII